MKRAISGIISTALLGGILVTGTAGTAFATGQPVGSRAVITEVKDVSPIAQVDPVGERRSMCLWKHDENDCASLLVSKKMTDMVKNCLLKAGIGGAGAFVIGKYVSKDVAKDIAAKVVGAGATACLSSFS
ncbi:hypothetical protein ACFXPX_26965 [Kitasatospora sp. NPDC059146]|uniref:hypothetical protein n=1 Tax=unclassified Kitasatospora TaxID=2633591 RepID=UPI003682991C